MCGFGFRPTSNTWGRSNTVSSRLAAIWKKTTFSSALIGWSSDHGVDDRLAAEVHDRGHPPQHLLHRGREQRPVGEQPLPLVGMVEEGLHAPGHQVAGGLVAGDGQQEKEKLQLEIGESLAVDLDQRQEVMGPRDRRVWSSTAPRRRRTAPWPPGWPLGGDRRTRDPRCRPSGWTSRRPGAGRHVGHRGARR